MKMEQEHNYQPVFIKTLLQNSGTATKAQIKQALIEANPDIVVPNDSHLTARNVLLKHKLIAEHADSYILMNYDTFSIDERNKLINLCNDKISEASAYASKTSRRLVLFSVSGDASFAHFEDTMLKDVDTTKLSQTKMKQFPRIRTWGSIPNKWALSKWSKLKQGDILLFYKDKQYITSAVLEGTEQNSTVAKEMWGTKPDSDTTWELIMYMKPESVKTANVDYQKLNKFLNYKENFMPTRTLDFTLVRADATKDLEKRHGSLENALSSIGFDFGKIVTIAQGSGAPGCDETHSCFIPEELHISKGDTVTWINTDTAAHTITSGDASSGPDGKFDSNLLSPGSQFTHKFNESGEHPYRCLVHPWMVGKIMVDQTTVSENYLLLRHNMTRDNPWSDEFGKSYHYGKIANYTKLTTDSKTIWYDRQDGKYVFLGHGDVGDIQEEPLGDDIYAKMINFEKFDPPKIATEELRGKITSMSNFNNQHSILPITKELYDEIVGIELKSSIGSEKPSSFKNSKLVFPPNLNEAKNEIQKQLLIPADVIDRIIFSLYSGKHVILTGPVGTGKTHLAKLIPKIAWSKIGGYYPETVTATSEWTTQDVVGGIFPKIDGDQIKYSIQKGCVADTISKNWLDKTGKSNERIKFTKESVEYNGVWLVIDEFNRANIDRAFGPLFTALEYKKLQIPTTKYDESYEELTIPDDYRIIGTLNTFDKHFLFRLSDALKRRFSFIEILPPTYDKIIEEIRFVSDKALENYDEIKQELKIQNFDDLRKNPEVYSLLTNLYEIMAFVRLSKNLGTAVLISMFRFALINYLQTKNFDNSLDAAVLTHLLPHLESLQYWQIDSIMNFVGGRIHEMFRKFDVNKRPDVDRYEEELRNLTKYLRVSGTNKSAGNWIAKFRTGEIFKLPTPITDLDPWSNKKRPVLQRFREALESLKKEKGYFEEAEGLNE